MLVTTKEMLEKARKSNYAVPAINTQGGNYDIIRACCLAAEEMQSPIILAHYVSTGAYAGHDWFYEVGKWMANKVNVPVAIHLDHGDSFETCKSCIDGGFTSVMIDGSHHSFKDNIELTRKVVEYAHDHGVVVEAELGRLAGVEDDVKVSAEDSSYTRPEEVEEFVTKTNVDSLAIAIGTCHGAFKFQGTPKLRFDILEEVAKRLPQFPIVLHGASSVPQEFVRMINENGGNMPGAQGVPEELLRKAASMAVCKINIDSDLRVAFTGTIRKYMNENPAHFDPRQYLAPARDAIKQIVAHKLVDVLGCAGKA
ncbi:MAG: ketose-bisphosphate aldolase [Clostridia bacterium]